MISAAAALRFFTFSTLVIFLSGNKGEARAQCGFLRMAEGYRAVLPEKLPDSSWAREDKVTVYTVDFKTAKNKPLSLQSLQIPEHRCTHPELFCVTGKEQGQCYYAAKPLGHSAPARAVLEACDAVQTAYKRLPSLLSPMAPGSRRHPRRNKQTTSGAGTPQ